MNWRPGRIKKRRDGTGLQSEQEILRPDPARIYVCLPESGAVLPHALSRRDTETELPVLERDELRRLTFWIVQTGLRKMTLRPVFYPVCTASADYRVKSIKMMAFLQEDPNQSRKVIKIRKAVYRSKSEYSGIRLTDNFREHLLADNNISLRKIIPLKQQRLFQIRSLSISTAATHIQSSWMTSLTVFQPCFKNQSIHG